MENLLSITVIPFFSSTARSRTVVLGTDPFAGARRRRRWFALMYGRKEKFRRARRVRGIVRMIDRKEGPLVYFRRQVVHGIGECCTLPTAGSQCQSIRNYEDLSKDAQDICNCWLFNMRSRRPWFNRLRSDGLG